MSIDFWCLFIIDKLDKGTEQLLGIAPYFKRNFMNIYFIL